MFNLVPFQFLLVCCKTCSALQGYSQIIIYLCHNVSIHLFTVAKTRKGKRSSTKKTKSRPDVDALPDVSPPKQQQQQNEDVSKSNSETSVEKEKKMPKKKASKSKTESTAAQQNEVCMFLR